MAYSRKWATNLCSLCKLQGMISPVIDCLDYREDYQNRLSLRCNEVFGWRKRANGLSINRSFSESSAAGKVPCHSLCDFGKSSVVRDCKY
jgi:hypothetical protein